MRELDENKYQIIIWDIKLCKVDESGEYLTDNGGNVILYDTDSVNGHYFEESDITGESLYVAV